MNETLVHPPESPAVSDALVMPRLVGLPLDRASRAVGHFGLLLETVRYEESENGGGRIGNVIRQSPEPGTPVRPAIPVRLVVAATSWRDFLPSIYQMEDDRAGGFLREFLWIFKHQWQPVEEILARLPNYFDPWETPRTFLPWLASLLALTLDEEWPEEKKRRLISMIVALYQLRGTLRGLKLYLEIFTDTRPQIYENEWPFNGFQVGVSSTIGVDSIIIGYIDPSFAFTVKLPWPIEDTKPEMVRRVHRIVAAERPAHTNYYMIFTEKEIEDVDFMQVGMQSMIGVDSWIGERGVETEWVAMTEEEVAKLAEEAEAKELLVQAERAAIETAARPKRVKGRKKAKEGDALTGAGADTDEQPDGDVAPDDTGNE
jgi:phage tail-like protein